MLSYEEIRNCNKNIIKSNDVYPITDKNSVILLFKEMLKEEIIKKGEIGSELIEEMMIIVEEMVESEKINGINAKYILTFKEFIEVAKEKGFTFNVLKYKDIIKRIIVNLWRRSCKENVCFDCLNYCIIFNY